MLYLIGDPTLKEKRGQQHPLGRPVALDVVDPKQKGHANELFRQMLKTFVPPAWARQVVVVADAGMAANETFRVLKHQHYDVVFAQARTRKFTDGKYLRDLVQHLPKCRYRRVASYKPDGRRKDYWIYSRQAALQTVGDVTLVLSKCRRNAGAKKVKIIVTNLVTKKAEEILSIYARRWGGR